MILFRRFFCSFYFIFLLLGTAYSQNLLDYSNSLKYADYLFNTNQYDLAAEEFERVVFLEPQDTLSKLKLIQSYRYLTDYKAALNRIAKFYPKSLVRLPEEFSIEYVKNLLHENQFLIADRFLESNNTIDVGVKAEYQLGILMMQCRWAEARVFADEKADVIKKTKNFDDLNSIVEEGVNANYKSPLFAGSISAIVPGGGKIYCGYLIDAIYSFLIVSGSTWLTYRSYQRNGYSFSTFFIGTFAFCFHSANIYGSVKSAKRYNRTKDLFFRSRTEDILLEGKY